MALQARRAWREADDEIVRWREQVEVLRRSFYDEDDPYYRDSQIKPAWDRAIQRLEEARLIAEDARQQLADLLQRGRVEGALPGWLREGIDLEPDTAPARNDLEEHRPSEPTVYEPQERDGDG